MGKNKLQQINPKRFRSKVMLPTDYVFMKKNFQREFADLFLAQMTENQKIVDFNAGTQGIYSLQNGRHHPQYFALEPNTAIGQHLKEQHIPVIDWGLPDLPLKNNSIDLFLSTPFIEHLPSYLDAMNLLIETHRTLKPGGRIILIVPNFMAIKEIFFEDYKHGWITTRKRMQDMLQECGFQTKSSRYTVGWITMSQNPLISISHAAISIIMFLLRLHFVDRTLEWCRLDTIANKFKKTFFELIVIEAQKI